ncbi:hypothetical protein L6452_31169 [Arctium lappa]|uniref:Uncharacterized protein n=1 Tax=Arctium lappa TaxID=4217 RepID=A0ACB8ZK28_ARCLA|nr:hypothetical protein L6452_31169 [Arctium lappa]
MESTVSTIVAAVMDHRKEKTIAGGAKMKHHDRESHDHGKNVHAPNHYDPVKPKKLVVVAGSLGKSVATEAAMGKSGGDGACDVEETTNTAGEGEESGLVFRDSSSLSTLRAR